MIVFLAVAALLVAAIALFMNRPEFGRAPRGERLERIWRSPNYRDGAFRNRHATPQLTSGKGWWATMYDFLFERKERNRPDHALPAVKTDLKALDPKENLLVWFGHSSYLIQADGLRILVDFTQYDYVVDAIDTVTGKIALVVKAKEAGTPIICAMGAGNKMDPTRFEVTDIYKTSVCPLAKVMRTECRKRRIKHLKVVYSKEPAMTPIEDDSISCKNHCICPPGTQRKCTIRRSVPGSNAFVPSVAGLIIGGEVVKDLVGFVPMKG